MSRIKEFRERQKSKALRERFEQEQARRGLLLNARRLSLREPDDYPLGIIGVDEEIPKKRIGG